MFELISIDYDERVKAYSIIARLDYKQYLELADIGHESLAIQRRIIKDKDAYLTLKNDLKRGCLMPAIILAANNFNIKNKKDIHQKNFLKTIESDLLKNLKKKDNLLVLDGQQRTRSLQTVREDLEKDKNKKNLDNFYNNVLRAEIWIGLSFGALAYRMLLLNAGQNLPIRKPELFGDLI